MRTVENIEEIKHNIQVLKGYLDSRTDPEYSWAIARIKKGTCFAAIKNSDGQYEFFPSRFIGYADNTMDKHDNNQYKDGTETTPAISKVLGHKEAPNPQLENEYIAFCERLGFTANARGSFNIERKYWEM